MSRSVANSDASMWRSISASWIPVKDVPRLSPGFIPLLHRDCCHSLDPAHSPPSRTTPPPTVSSPPAALSSTSEMRVCRKKRKKQNKNKQNRANLCAAVLNIRPPSPRWGCVKLWWANAGQEVDNDSVAQSIHSLRASWRASAASSAFYACDLEAAPSLASGVYLR